MRQLTPTQKVAHLEHRISTLEKQALFGLFKDKKKQEAQKILDTLEGDLRKGYLQWVTGYVSDFRLDEVLGRGHEQKFLAGWKKIKTASELYKKGEKNTYFGALRLSSQFNFNWLVGVEIVFYKKGFAVHLNGRMAMQCRNINDIKNGRTWESVTDIKMKEKIEVSNKLYDEIKEFIRDTGDFSSYQMERIYDKLGFRY